MYYFENNSSSFIILLLTCLLFSYTSCSRGKLRTYYREKIFLRDNLSSLNCSFEDRDDNIYYFKSDDILESCYREDGRANGNAYTIESLYKFIKKGENLHFKYEFKVENDTIKVQEGQDLIKRKRSEISEISRGMQAMSFYLLTRGKGQVFVKDGAYYPKYLIYKKERNRVRSVIFTLELPDKKILRSLRLRG